MTDFLYVVGIIFVIKSFKKWVACQAVNLPDSFLDFGASLSKKLYGLRLQKMTRNVGSSLEYASQYGQDRYVWEEIFQRQRHGGYFLDIGAYDGVLNSNTLFFEKQCGFRGLLVEANPLVAERLQRNRSSCVLNCGVGKDCDSGAELDFWACTGYGEQLSCFRDLASSGHIARIDAEKSIHGFEIHCRRVALKSFQEILSHFNSSEIDLLSIDIEGAELAVLRCFPFWAKKVRVLVVEANDAYGLECYLRKFGFKLEAVVGTDLIFVNKFW